MKWINGLPKLGIFIMILLVAAFFLLQQVFADSLPKNLLMVSTTSFLLRPTENPDDTRLLFSTWLLENPLRNDVDQLIDYSRRIEYIKQTLTDPSLTHQVRGRLSLERAEIALARNDASTSLDYFIEAMNNQNHQVKLQALLGLTRSISDGDEVLNHDHLLDEISKIEPEFEVDLRACEPDLEIGVHIEQGELKADDQVELILTWEVSPDNDLNRTNMLDELAATPGQWDLYRIGDRVFLVGTVKNQVNNGSFERVPFARKGTPSGFIPLYRSQGYYDTAIEYDSWDTDVGRSMVLSLQSNGKAPVGLGTNKVLVSDNGRRAVFLIAGKYRTTIDAEPKIGIRWLLENATKWSDNSSIYVMKKVFLNWEEFISLQAAPSGTVATQLWILNQDISSGMWADNLILVQIPRPCLT